MVSFQHGDKESQLQVLLDNHRYKTLVESFPSLRAIIIEFLANAVKRVTRLLDLNDCRLKFFSV
jgi:hypothetical protein